MPAHHQDVWWRPTTDIGLTEPRWVRAVEMRPGTLQGRRIIHHAVAYLVQDDDPDSINQGIVTAVANNATATICVGRRAYFMEWAIGKGYDLYRPDTGQDYCCRVRRSPGTFTSTPSAKRFEDDVELGIWLYPKGQEPKHRTYLIPFHRDSKCTGVVSTSRRIPSCRTKASRS